MTIPVFCISTVATLVLFPLSAVRVELIPELSIDEMPIAVTLPWRVADACLIAGTMAFLPASAFVLTGALPALGLVRVMVGFSILSGIVIRRVGSRGPSYT